jgi:hypothetical protein
MKFRFEPRQQRRKEDINMGQERQDTSTSPESPSLLEPDRDQLEIFVDAIFRHAGTQGFVSLRGFFEGDASKPFRITPISLAGDLKFLVDAAEDDARRAALDPKAVVFAPPLAVFAIKEHAREKVHLGSRSVSSLTKIRSKPASSSSSYSGRPLSP